MSVEGNSPRTHPISPRFKSSSSAASKAPAHSVTHLAASKLPTHSLPPEEATAVRVHMRPVHSTSQPTSLQQAPLLENATAQQIKQYLVNWVMENPQLHTKETAQKIMFFLGSLETQKPHIQLKLDQNLCALPDIFHTKLLADHLKHLDLKGCSRLTELPASIGALKNLIRLDLNGCTGLHSLPDAIADLNKLTIIGLGDCSQLAALSQALLHTSMSNGKTLLDQAVSEKNEDGVRLLIRLGADVNRSAADGYTPMTRAVVDNDPSMVRLLKSLGADANQPASNGDTPLICAINEENTDMMQFLLDELEANINQPGGNGVTPLITAMLESDTETVRWLISKGADVNQFTGAGYSPLAIAILQDDTDMVTVLKTDGGVNFNKPANTFGETPLIIATLTNKPDMVKLLKRLGANVNLAGEDGEPPMAKALLYDIPGMAPLLKSLGANQKLSEKIIKTKFLAHAWGMKGKYQVDTSLFELEILPTIYSMQMLGKYVSDFFKSDDFLLDPSINHALSPKNRKTIQQIIEQSFPRSSDEVLARGLSSLDVAGEIVNQVQLGEPFLILGGTMHHAMSMVLHDDKLILFNRGEGKSGDAVKSYHLPASTLTPEILAQLTNTTYPTVQAFYDMIHALNLTPANWSYDQNPQEISNCAWASAKGGFGILCRLFADSEEAGELIYKKFTRFVRNKTFSEFQLEYGHEDALIHQIEIKGIQKGIFPAVSEKVKQVA